METTATRINKSSELKIALTRAKLAESAVIEERAISWLDAEKVCFLVKTKINLNEKFVYVG